jgi:hypothetical protein
MEPRASVDFFARIRKWLGNLGVQVFKPGLRCCVVCGKSVGTLHMAGTHVEPDSRPLCRSCFELLLRSAERKSLVARELASESLNDFDEHLA